MRPNVGGAIVLTIAAILLITAGYLYFAFVQTEPVYKEVFSRRFSMLSGGTASHEIKEVEEGRIYDVSVSIEGYILEEDTPAGKVINKFYVAISDARAKIVETKAHTYFAWTLYDFQRPITIEIKNLTNQTLYLSLRIVDSTRTERRPFEQVSQWMCLISIPIIMLGIWMMRLKPN